MNASRIMNHTLRRALIALCLIFATSGSTFAEEFSGLQPGTRIRATYLAEQYQGKTRSRQISGTLEELTGCTLGVSKSPNMPLIYLPRENITRLERSIHPSRRDKAMQTGFLTGASLATVITVALVLDKPQPGEWDLRGLAFIFGGMLWLACTTVGVLVGLMLPGEKWQDVDLSKLTLDFATPGDHEGRLLLGFRF